MQILSSDISRTYKRIIHLSVLATIFLEMLEYLIEELIYSNEVLVWVQYSVSQQGGYIIDYWS
jgi:hypothetical protein